MVARVMGLVVVLTGGSHAQTPAPASEKVLYLLPSLATLPAFAPFMLAQYKGYYKNEGLEVEFQTGKGGTDVAKQLGAGNGDLGGGVGDTSILVRPNGIPVKAVAVLGGRSLLTIAVHEDSGIQDLKGLKGKTIVVWSLQDTTYYSLLGTLAAVGMTKDDVNIQSVGPVNVWKLFVARQADAMGAVPDWLASAEAAGAKMKMFPAHDFFPNMPQAIIASDKMIATKPDIIRKFVRATLKGMKDIIDNPEVAAEEYVKAVPANAERLQEMKRTLRLYTTLVYAGQKRIGEMDDERFAKLQDYYLAEKIIDKKSDVKDLYTNDFIP
ncbi:MAG: ABC transporter substrate-binding protein [Xanthobacteraceae bacterium]|nr:MAG: ABC transporter substrate-binding protein [Xanthobacteraceae bacterium]